MFKIVDIDEKKIVDIEEEIRSLQLDSADTTEMIGILVFPIYNMDGWVLFFVWTYIYIYIYIYCLCLYWNLAEDNNGVVNAEDEIAQHEELEKVDKMEEGW